MFDLSTVVDLSAAVIIGRFVSDVAFRHWEERTGRAEPPEPEPDHSDSSQDLAEVAG